MSNVPVYFGVKKAARELNLSENRIRQLADQGKLPCVRDSENRRQFAADDILARKRKRPNGRPVARQATA